MSQKKLHLQKLVDVIRRKHFSLSTERTYCQWVSKFWDFAKTQEASLSREKKFEMFLTAEARRGCAASTQNQAFNAVCFFFKEVMKTPLGEVNALRAKAPAMVRFAPSREDTGKMIRAVQDIGGYPTSLLARLLYGCGMRVSEPLSLRIRDMDLDRSRITIRQAKGRKDRVVALPCSLVNELKSQIKIARGIWERDQASGIPCKLPGLLGEKYPGYEHAWAWFFVFPQHTTCRDPRDGREVRWHCHEANLQRSVKQAAAKVGIHGVTPHHLRHAYATHALDFGANVRAVQEAMGHKSLETTMGYIHTDALSVKSPLEIAFA